MRIVIAICVSVVVMVILMFIAERFFKGNVFVYVYVGWIACTFFNSTMDLLTEKYNKD